jgi:hypothetical protein
VNVDQAHTGTVPSIPAELEQLAPPPLLLSGKSIQRYHLMRRAVLLELAPRSAIDWILATDVVESSWEHPALPALAAKLSFGVQILDAD